MSSPEQKNHVSVAWTRAQPIVTSYISALVPDFHAVEDILQSVALIVVKKTDDYDPSKPFLAWALGIARNEVLHYRRSKARETLVFNDSLMKLLSRTFAEQEEHSKEIRRAMTGCLKHLSGRPREVFRLRYGEQMAVKTIAKQLETSANTVSVTLNRCREALRKCLSQQLGGGVWQS